MPWVGEIPDQTLASIAGEGAYESWLSKVTVRAVEINRMDDQGYWHLLDDTWRECGEIREDLIVVEHDILVNPSTLYIMASHIAPWCAAPYKLAYGYDTGLGCTKFSGRLMADFPSLVAEAGRIPVLGMPDGHWKRLDTRLRCALMPITTECRHHHTVEHTHEYPPQPYVGNAKR